MTADKLIRMAFNSHGLGDVVHCATAMRLYIDRGYDVAIQVEPNKRWVWEAAGVPIYDGPDQLPLHPYYYPDMRKYFDLSEPDEVYNKAAHLFEVTELPNLGTKEEVWKALCEVRLDASPHISPEAHAEAEEFLEGLPHPIFVLHSKGTNWQAEKSIPDGVAFELLFKLLETGGSVVVLDYDARVPVVTGHPRVRSIKAVGGGGWGHIGCDRLCALLSRTDLFIGVDSGPFHVASLMTDVKCLGVFRKIPPVRCCLPSRNATYLVPAADHEHWESRGSEWRFVEYPMADVSSNDIAVSAANIVFPEDLGMSAIKAADVPGRYLYRRVGYDERLMDLLEDGTIGTGAAGCERVWVVERTPIGSVLTIYGQHGGPTCHLKLEADRVLRGRWLNHEQMPVELIRDVELPVVQDTTTRKDLRQIDAVCPTTLSRIDIAHRGETHKAHDRRRAEHWFAKHVQVPGIDIGCGDDPLLDDSNWRRWDIKRGDSCAQKMAEVPDEQYMTVYASHILEYLTDPIEAIRNWYRILAVGGQLIICVPHRDLYEKLEQPPSQWDQAHRWFWLPNSSEGTHTLGLRETIQLAIPGADIVSLKVLADGYRRNGSGHPAGEYSVEAIVRKPLVSRN